MKRKPVVWVLLAAGGLVALGSLLRRRTAQARRHTMSKDNQESASEDSLEVVEVETEGVDNEGNLVIDDLMVAVDGEGRIVATDETVAVINPGGDVVVEEDISVLEVEE
jgi:hypothetical protein